MKIQLAYLRENEKFKSVTSGQCKEAMCKFNLHTFYFIIIISILIILDSISQANHVKSQTRITLTYIDATGSFTRQILSVIKCT